MIDINGNVYADTRNVRIFLVLFLWHTCYDCIKMIIMINEIEFMSRFLNFSFSLCLSYLLRSLSLLQQRIVQYDANTLKNNG